MAYRTVRPMEKDYPKTAALLRRIRQHLGGEEGGVLWEILTALRGPDSESDGLKNCTTAVIRHAVAPSMCHGMEEADSVERLHDRFDQPGGHFLGHARSAFRSLGLDWEKVNCGDPLRHAKRSPKKKSRK